MLQNRLLHGLVLAAGGLFVSTAMANTPGSEKDPAMHDSADVSFEKIDANGDGYISQSEFQDSQLNIEHSDLDTDNDGRVNQTEFAAFEQMHLEQGKTDSEYRSDAEYRSDTEYQVDPTQEELEETEYDQ